MEDDYQKRTGTRRTFARSSRSRNSEAPAQRQPGEGSASRSSYRIRTSYGADTDLYKENATYAAAYPRYGREEPNRAFPDGAFDRENAYRASNRNAYPDEEAYYAEDDYDEGDFSDEDYAMQQGFAADRANRTYAGDSAAENARQRQTASDSQTTQAMQHARAAHASGRPVRRSSYPGRTQAAYREHMHSDKRFLADGEAGGNGGGRGRNGNGRAYGQDPEEGGDMNAAHSPRPKKRRSKAGRIVRIVLLLLVLFAGFSFAKTISKGIHWTVAVFGVDSRDGSLEKGTRSDVIMLANINQLTGEVRLCSVFRDTYLQIDTDGTLDKINEAYAKGGHKQAVKALSENLDVKIDDYVTFNWAAVAKGINALGGIDLELSDAEFSYINAFITETVNSTGIGSTQLKHAGMNHLDGVQAVSYGRLRLMDTDYNRTARQRKVISLALDKAKQADSGQLANAAKSLIGEVSTSIGIGDVLPVINSLGKYNIPDDASSGFPFSRQAMKLHGQDCVIPTTLESNVVTLHEFLFGKKNFTPSATVQKISAAIGAATGLTQAGENAPEAKTGGGVAHKNKKQTNGGASSNTKQTEAVTEAVTETEKLEPESSTASDITDNEDTNLNEGSGKETTDDGEWAERPDNELPATKPESDGPGEKETEAQKPHSTTAAAENNEGPGADSSGHTSNNSNSGNGADAPATTPAVVGPAEEGGPGAQ